LNRIGVTWISTEVWPYAYPAPKSGQRLLNDIEIVPDLLHTGAGKDMLSSTEMNFRMSLNIAKFLYHSEWFGDTILCSGEPVE